MLGWGSGRESITTGGLRMRERKDSRDNLCSRVFGAVVTPGGARRFSATFLILWLAAHLLPASTVRPALGFVVVAACVANLGRIGTHLYGGYLWLRREKIEASPKPTVRRQLTALVIANLALTLLGLADGIWLMANPEAALLWRMVPPSLLCLAFYAVALATVDRADALDLDRGTEIVRKSPFGQWLFKIGKRGTRFKPVKWLVDLFDNPTPEGESSTLAILIAAAILLAPLATGAIELSTSAKKEAIAAFETLRGGEEPAEGTSELSDDESGVDGDKSEEAPQPSIEDAIPSPAPGAEAGKERPKLPVRELDGPAAAAFDVVVGKGSTDDPGRAIPVSRSDLPYILAVLPMILRLQRWVEAQGGTLAYNSIYVTTDVGTTLFFRLVEK